MGGDACTVIGCSIIRLVECPGIGCSLEQPLPHEVAPPDKQVIFFEKEEVLWRPVVPLHLHGKAQVLLSDAQQTMLIVAHQGNPDASSEGFQPFLDGEWAHISSFALALEDASWVWLGRWDPFPVAAPARLHP